VTPLLSAATSAFKTTEINKRLKFNEYRKDK
jgi:hypothetical protein